MLRSISWYQQSIVCQHNVGGTEVFMMFPYLNRKGFFFACDTRSLNHSLSLFLCLCLFVTAKAAHIVLESGYIQGCEFCGIVMF